MQTKRMWLVMLAIAALTVLKIAFPAASLRLTQSVSTLVGSDADYIYLVRAMGRSMIREGAGGELKEALNDTLACGERGQAAPTAAVPETVTRTFTIRRSQGRGGEDDNELYEERPTAVEAFLQRQAQFKGCAIPANVRTDMPSIPFQFVRPVEGVGSSGFGYRLHPLKGRIVFHYGTDLAADEGETVRAFADGYIYAAGTSDSYGNYYIVTHKGGFTSLYAHLSEFTAVEGETIKMGETLGKVGQTGEVTGPHLHFELLINDIYINPEYYI